jgi:branched-chain amino acid transport system substrate-binding protein
MELMPDQRFQNMAEFKQALLEGDAAVFAAGAFTGVASSAAPSSYPTPGTQPPLAPTQAAVSETPPTGKTRKMPPRWILFSALGGLILMCIVCLILAGLNERGKAASATKTAKALAAISGQSPTQAQAVSTATTISTATAAPPTLPALSPTPFECTDALGCVDVAPGDPVRIASALAISGPNADLGTDSQYGVEIAIDFKGELLGHPIELQAEDDGCSAEGGQTAGQKIVSDPNIVAIVGSTCSIAGAPMSKVVSDAGYVMVSPSNTAPALTDPASHQAGYLRTVHNDKVQGKALAEFALNVLGVKSAAAIHDGGPYTESLARVFTDEFEALGGEVVAFTAVNKGDTDMRPVLIAVAASGPPEFLYYPVFTAEGGFLTRQAKEVAGLENTILSAADGMSSEAAIEAVGEAGEGMYFSGPDLSFSGETYDKFIARYEEKYGSKPVSVFHAHAFDAANMIFACIEKVAVQDEDGALHIGRQALRDCLFATSSLTGITGSLTCDQYGDCADPRISVSQLRSGEYVRIWP